MVSTRKKRQSSRRLLSQLDDFDQDMIIGNTSNAREENVVVNEGTNDRDFSVGTSNNDSVLNGNAISVKTLERCFNERIDKELNNIVDTVEDRIQNAILTAIENIVAPKIELAIRSITVSSGRDTTSVTANSERGERVGINAFFENASESNNTLRVPNVNDETRLSIPDEVSELSVPETRFDRQPQTHHIYTFPSRESERFTRQIKVQIGKSTLIILYIKGKMPILARNKYLSVHLFLHGPRLLHLSTEKVRVQSVRNGHQSGYSCANTMNKNINKR